MQVTSDPFTLMHELVTNKHNIHVGKVDLSKNEDLDQPETANRKLNAIVKGIFTTPRRHIDTLILRSKAVSGSALLGFGEQVPKHILKLREGLRVLDFSETRASATAIHLLSEFPKLEVAHFNNCPNVILKNIVPHQNIKTLSLLGTRILPGCVLSILASFPKLETLDYTVNLSDQVPIGFEDAQNIHHPSLTVPCGHFHQDRVKHTCKAENERDIFLSEIPVRIRKIEGIWQVFVLDAFLQPIESGKPIYLHESCKRFYSQVRSEETLCSHCHKPIEEGLHPVFATLNTAYNPADFIRLEPRSYYEIVQRAIESQNN